MKNSYFSKHHRRVNNFLLTFKTKKQTNFDLKGTWLNVNSNCYFYKIRSKVQIILYTQMFFGLDLILVLIWVSFLESVFHKVSDEYLMTTNLTSQLHLTSEIFKSCFGCFSLGLTNFQPMLLFFSLGLIFLLVFRQEVRKSKKSGKL